MIRWFKWCMGAVIAVLVVWWLNIPFLDSQRDDAPLIVTSTPITQHLVETIMGPDVQIVSLVDRLKDPARQTISVDKLAKLSNADVLIINGGGLEASYGDLSPYIKKTTRVINLHDLMTTYEKRWPTHYWMNPVSWNKLVYYLQIRLKAIFPKRESEINYRKQAYNKEIHKLYQAIRESVATTGRKTTIATNHASFEPFAKAFGIKCLTIDLVESLKNNTLSEVVDELKKKNIKVLYPNAALPDTGIDELVKMAMAQGWPLTIGKPLFSLNLDVRGSGASTYIEMMTLNARTLIGT